MYTPPIGFYFSVSLAVPGTELAHENDSSFQEVAGLTVELETEEVAEGGENRFTHKLPVRTKYTELELKRGLYLDSALVTWCRNALENFSFLAGILSIALKSSEGKILMLWEVVGAYPIHWSVSPFNAEDNNIVIESIKFNYQYFRVFRNPTL